MVVYEWRCEKKKDPVNEYVHTIILGVLIPSIYDLIVP